MACSCVYILVWSRTSPSSMGEMLARVMRGRQGVTARQMLCGGEGEANSLQSEKPNFHTLNSIMWALSWTSCCFTCLKAKPRHGALPLRGGFTCGLGVCAGGPGCSSVQRLLQHWAISSSTSPDLGQHLLSPPYSLLAASVFLYPGLPSDGSRFLKNRKKSL